MDLEPLQYPRRSGVDHLGIVHDDLRYAYFRNLFLAALTRTATAMDVDRLRFELERFAAGQDQPVVLIIQLGPEVGAPDAAARRALGRLMKTVDQVASYGAFVVEASGFWAATLRAVQAGIELAVGSRLRLEFWSCVTAALAKAKPRVQGAATDMELMVAAGTVRARPPGVAEAGPPPSSLRRAS